MSSIKITTKTEIEDCVCELSVEIEFTDIFRQLAKTTVHSYKEITDKGVYIIAGYKLGLEKCKEIVVANPNTEKVSFEEEYMEEIFEDIDRNVFPISVFEVIDEKLLWEILGFARYGYELGLKHYLGIYKENKKIWNIFVKGGR